MLVRIADMQRRKAKAGDALIDATVRSKLTGAQALGLYEQGLGVVTLALLAASKRIAELQAPSKDQPRSPSTPSGMVPIYIKADTPRRHREPGEEKAHRRSAETFGCHLQTKLTSGGLGDLGVYYESWRTLRFQ